jgi:hypothetical protein
VTPTKPSPRSRRLPSRPLRSPRHPHPLLPQRPPPRRSRSRQPRRTASPLRPRPFPARSPRLRVPRPPSPRPPLRPRRLRPRPSSSPRLRPPPHRHPPRRLRPLPRLPRLPAPSRVARVRALARLRSSNSPSSRRLRPRPLVRSPRPWCRRARRLPSLPALVPRVRATTPSASVAATLPARVLDLVPARVRSRAATAPPARSPVTRVLPVPVRQLPRVAAVPVLPVKVVLGPLLARVGLVPLPVRAVLAPTRATCLRARTPA